MGLRRMLSWMSLSVVMLLAASCEKSDETRHTAKRCEELGGLVIWDNDYPQRVLSCIIPCNYPQAEHK